MLRARLVPVLLLALAPASPAAGDPPAEALLAAIPFHPQTPPKRIVIDLAPPENQRRFPLMLDTGATHSVLSPRTARALGVSVRRTKRTPYRRSTLLGRDLHFHVATRSSDTAVGPGGFEYGLLGGDFLDDFVVELDFATRHVRFYDPRRYAVPEQTGREDEVVLPMKLASTRVAVEALVNGKPLPLLVDTGAPMGLLLSGKFAAQVGVASAPQPGFVLQSMVGPVEAELGSADTVAFGPIAFHDVPTAVAPHGFMNLGFPGDSILGYDLLARFLVRLDYRNRRILLRRVPEASPLPPAAEPPPAPPGSPLLELPASEAAGVFEAVAPRDAGPLQQVWLEWGAPAPGLRVAGPVGWVEVGGWAGVGDPVRHDVVLVIDVSGSTAYASGSDVDGDGRLGRRSRNAEDWRRFNPRHLSSDPGDTVLAAELLATRRLVERLDPDRTRIGLVAFSSGAHVLAPLGSDAQRIDRALTDLEQAFGSGSTDLAAAIQRATEVLTGGETPGGSERRRSILVLSDGWPTAPGSARSAAQAAYEAARDASDGAGARLYTFALGLDDLERGNVYRVIAEQSGGAYRHVAEPGRIVHELARVDLADVAGIEIENASHGTRARATRTRPDGSFDGFVLLEPGENVLRVTARGDAGAERVEERRVHFDARAPRDEEEARAFEERLTDLRLALE
ncbi:MAG: aspartyl protease family protein, partial [Myxococcota bacterium]